MKLIMLFAAIFISIVGRAQSHVTLEDKNNAERFEVLKSDKRIKDGSFLRFTAPNFLTTSVEGYYHNNLRDSTWKYFSGGNLVAAGSYKQGEKFGVWTGYTRGFERLKYDFTNNKLLLYIPALTDSIFLFKPTEATTSAIVTRRPIYINGMLSLSQFLMRNIRYTPIALENRIQGEMLVSFVINKEGHAESFAVNGTGWYDLKTEVLRVFERLQGEWVPGVAGGKLTDFTVEMPIVFEINKSMNTPHQPNQIIIVRAASATFLR